VIAGDSRGIIGDAGPRDRSWSPRVANRDARQVQSCTEATCENGFPRNELLGECRADSAAADEAEADDGWSHASSPPRIAGLASRDNKKVPDGESPGTRGFLAFV
jgi:hypothetical protein